jgi:copper chaperone CopZ
MAFHLPFFKSSDEADAAAQKAATNDFDRTIELGVSGMTCDHCVAHVTEELKALPDVGNVSVTLNSGGTSKVLVYTDHDIADEALREAVSEAGHYTVESIVR